MRTKFTFADNVARGRFRNASNCMSNGVFTVGCNYFVKKHCCNWTYIKISSYISTLELYTPLKNWHRIKNRIHFYQNPSLRVNVASSVSLFQIKRLKLSFAFKRRDETIIIQPHDHCYRFGTISTKEKGKYCKFFIAHLEVFLFNRNQVWLMSVHKNKTVHLGKKTNIYTVHVQRNTAPADLVGPPFLLWFTSSQGTLLSLR